MKISTLALLVGLCAAPVTVYCDKLILNEYNAVSTSNFLNGGDEFMDGDGNVPPPADAFFGRVAGNGGDWFELVVVADHLDVRGWKLAIVDDGVAEPPLVLTNDPVWADLRAGTIITVSEAVPDDVSYAPAGGDWRINVRAAAPADGGTGAYISAANFTVSNDDWQLTIRDGGDALVFGPAGEGIVDDDGVPLDVGVNSEETFSLQGTPSALVKRFSSTYSDSRSSSFGHENELGAGAVQDFDALRLGLPVPDRDGDGVGDDGDQSGIVGDAPCIGGEITSCDDNCITQQNAEQSDTGWLGGGFPDGIGDACQCGDVNDDGILTQTDVILIRDGNVTDTDKCSVTGGTECNVADAAALARALRGDPGAISQVCAAAVIPEDDSDFVFDPQRVLQVAVSMNAADFELLRNETRTLEDLVGFEQCGEEPWPSPFNWYTAQVTIDGQTIDTVGIRKKGFLGSLSVDKPALKLELDRFVAGQELSGVSRFTFNNSKQDPSLVHQCLSFAFFARAGIPVPRCNFAHVVVNGEDLGVFVNVETVKEPFLARNFPDASGKLWEATISDFWPVNWSGTFEPETDAAEDDRTELDATANVMQQFTGPALLEQLEPLVDIDQFITYWAAEVVAAHIDGYHFNGNNYFIYLDPTIGRFQFFPWDMDSDLESDPTDSIFEARTALARKLYNVPETRALFLGRVQTLLDTAWQPQVSLSEIARMRALLTPVLLAAGMQQELRDMLTAQQTLRQWIGGRAASVNAQLANPPPRMPPGQIPHLCDL